MKQNKNKLCKFLGNYWAEILMFTILIFVGVGLYQTFWLHFLNIEKSQECFTEKSQDFCESIGLDYESSFYTMSSVFCSKPTDNVVRGELSQYYLKSNICEVD
jgi:hypothetical protein